MAAKPKPLPVGGTDERTTKKHRRGTRHAGDDGGGTRKREASDRLNDLLEQFGGGGFRLLAERTDNTNTTEYLGPVPFTSELYETVRQRFGGGLFGGRIVNERGRYQARIQQFRIAGTPRVPDDEPRAIAGGATGLEATLQAINANLTALTLQRAQPSDPVDQVVKIARALREAGGSASSTAGAGSGDSIAMMREMYGFMRELREENAPAAPESGFGAVIREGVLPLVGVLNRKLDIDQQERDRRRRLTASGGVPSSSAVPVVASPTVNEETVIPSDELAALLLTLPMPARKFLQGCAENDDDPEDYVALVFNRLTDDAYEAMARHLPRADFVDVLISVIPAYAAQREWFERLVEAMRATVAAAAVEGDGDDGPPEPAAHGVEAVT